MEGGAWWAVVHGAAELDATEHARMTQDKKTCKIKIFSWSFNIKLLKINRTDREVDGYS